MFLRSFLASFRFHFLRYRYMYDLFVFPSAVFCGYTVGAAPLQLSDPDPDRIGFWDCDGDSVAQGCSVCSLVALRCSCCFVRRSSSTACCFPRFCSLTFHHWNPCSSLHYSTVTCLTNSNLRRKDSDGGAPKLSPRQGSLLNVWRPFSSFCRGFSSTWNFHLWSVA